MWDCFCQDSSNNFVISTGVITSFFWQADIVGFMRQTDWYIVVPTQIFHYWLISRFLFFFASPGIGFFMCSQLFLVHFPQWHKVEKQILSLIPTTRVIWWNISRNKTSLCCPSQHWVAGMLPKHEDFWGLLHYYLWGVRNFHKSFVKDQYKKVLVELELTAGLSVCCVSRDR